MPFAIHPWKLIQTGLDLEAIRLSESLMSAGNGYMGMRGNFEEDFSGDTHIGTYIGGVWFPDKTRVGWWKNGYPEYFGKTINAVRMNGVRVRVDGETVDLATLPCEDYLGELDMQSGVISRSFTVQTQKGKSRIAVRRFLSAAQKELMAVSYAVTPDHEAEVECIPYLDGRVKNLDSNYDETFWEMLQEEETENALGLLAKTRQNTFGTPRFAVAAAMSVWADELELKDKTLNEGYVEACYSGTVPANQTAKIEKYVLCFTDRDQNEKLLMTLALKAAARARETGFESLCETHCGVWRARWAACDVEILGDEKAQQGIRYNLYQLLSTYSGDDARLNIGPKGFSGEKYGGGAYWDTEGFCFSMYMAVAGEHVARQLLLYRHMQLDGAYHNARMQGLPGALFPMVTFTGVECHNEWEITFEEIHRNAAIAHAIFDYSTYTGDEGYALSEGLDVLCGIARFYAGRVHFNKRLQKYMIHGVTGPNEYENNVNNNWYTNRMAAWSIAYFCETYEKASEERRDSLGIASGEINRMREISETMYYPEDTKKGVFIQHDTFLDKDLMPASALTAEDRPINKRWSWDRILRSCFLKQADVLQGLYFLNHLYDLDTKKRNFDFYEPMTVHESSLSPCVHAILAAELKYHEKAVEMFERTARLDLDNINRDTDDGLHVTSMAGSWLSIVHGFAGMRTVNGLSFRPFLPGKWKGYAFQLLYRGRRLRAEIGQKSVKLVLLEGEALTLRLYDTSYKLKTTVSAALQ
ncbi:MAG: glycoside hydrolase family 65 protein [Clostridiales bacterium]|nr:glycoside hydrolase family 65 protein [Clostridiales bacterium]